MELIFLKLGGSLITDKTETATARERVIRRAAQEVRRAFLARHDLQLLIGHGSGSFGHVAAKHWRFAGGQRRAGDYVLNENELRWGYAHIGAAAARLNRIVTDIFLEEGVPVATIQPSASAWCRDGEIVELATHTVENALARRIVPLVYGDVAQDEVKGATIISTEHIFTYLARHLHPTRIVLAGIVAGVFDRNPMQDATARLIPKITPHNYAEIETALTGSHGIDVTGGMWSKVQMMYRLIQELPHVRVQIISGAERGLMERVLTNEDDKSGTIIVDNPTYKIKLQEIKERQSMSDNQEAERNEADSAPPKREARKLPRGEVVIFQQWCKGCGICVALCPQKVLELNCDGHSEVVHPELCTACRQCEVHCPDLAITVWRIGENKSKRSE